MVKTHRSAKRNRYASDQTLSLRSAGRTLLFFFRTTYPFSGRSKFIVSKSMCIRQSNLAGITENIKVLLVIIERDQGGWKTGPEDIGERQFQSAFPFE